MRRRGWRPGRPLLCALSVALLGALAITPPGGVDRAARAAQPDQPARTAHERDTSTVTLVTGDRVRITEHPKQPPSIDIEPGDGREDMPFVDRVTPDGRITVIPADALPLLGEGRLDQRLFDVSLLLDAGYHDEGSDTLPLIVSTDGKRRPRALTAPGVRRVRPLNSVDATAMRAAKPSLERFWERVIGAEGDRTLAAGVRKVWLDGPVHAALEKSVPQVGAPTAWDAGYTGAGTRVAVLDTGVDAEHPDLTDAVTAARDFTGADDPTDRNGHGTHVASIVAGSGAASEGRRTGVAPDAELLIGKVLNDSGSGTDSDIIRGMEWAVEQRADVVNLSLGGCVRGEDDPLVTAVDRLTESSGTLFVVAAGNHGETDGPCWRDDLVASPATADHALAVGSVDSSDQLSDFSNIGPRWSDGAVKPEITAPGQQVTAARAGESSGAGRYVEFSGTSMAAPHVAGGAALLAQQHPKWQAEALRERLVATAEPNPELGVFHQGAGRLALDAAIEDPTVVARPALISAPRQMWPHGDDEPWSTDVTYANTSDRPVKLTLSTAGTRPDGAPANEDMFTVEQRKLTVPPRQERSVTVSVDTSVSSPDGLFGGELEARSGGERVARTPIGVEKEVESHDLELALTDRSGEPAAGQVVLSDPDTGEVAELAVSAEGSSYRLPAGRYDLTTAIVTDPNGATSLTLAAKPNIRLDSDRTVDLDAREGRRVGAEPPSAKAKPSGRTRTWVATDQVNYGVLGGDDPNTAAALYATPTGRVESRRYEFGWLGALHEPVTEELPRAYQLYLTEAGGIPDDPVFQVDPDELARVRNQAHSQGVRDEQDGTVHFGVTAKGHPLIYNMQHPVRTPGEWLDFVSAGDHLTWSSELVTPRGAEYHGTAWAPSQYQPGERATVRWNAAPVGVVLRTSYAYDRFWNNVSAFAPSSPGHTSWLSDTTGTDATFVMRKDGEEVLRTSDPNGGDPVSLPAERGSYEWELNATRDVPWSTLGTEVDATWKITAGPDEQGQLPIPGVWITGDVDRLGRLPGDGASELGIRVQLPDGGVPEIRQLRMRASFDDGANWRRVEVEPDGDGFVAEVPEPPESAAFVSVRTELETDDGSEVRQTVLRSYGLK